MELVDLEYRRGYTDGWIEAAEKMKELLTKTGLDCEAARNACWDHWLSALMPWKQADCNKLEMPPELRLASD